MRQTRRRFVQSAAALTGAAIWPLQAVGGVTPLRMSLEDFSNDSAKVASLRKGVAVMKARAPSDHGSWFFQAAIHAYNDAAYQAALKSDPKVAQVDAARFWNRCPHFGQSSADFLIWHRAYLFNFERILRAAADDPSLALPYWDYSKPEMRGFPGIFANPYVDSAGKIPNPLYHPNREQAFVTGRFELSDEVCEATATMLAATFFSDIGLTGFAGDTLDSEHTQLGLIEQRPHNDIHIAVGGIVGTANGAMADVPTAAFDPVFWVHHANIDRLWAEWSCMAGKSWGPLPPSDWLDDEPWEFIDVDGSIKRASRRFFIDRRNITVTYDTDARNGPPLALPPAPVMAAAPPSANRAPQLEPLPSLKTAAPRALDREIVADNTPLNLLPSVHLAHALPPAAAPPVAPLTGSFGLLGAHRKAKRILLELSEISFERVPSSGFAVYLANTADIAAGKVGRFVGLLDLFGSTHAHMSGMAMMSAVQRFDVTSIVAQRGANLASLTLRVEPYSLFVSKEGRAAPQRSDTVKIGKVRFVEVT